MRAFSYDHPMVEEKNSWKAGTMPFAKRIPGIPGQFRITIENAARAAAFSAVLST